MPLSVVTCRIDILFFNKKKKGKFDSHTRGQLQLPFSRQHQTGGKKTEGGKKKRGKGRVCFPAHMDIFVSDAHGGKKDVRMKRKKGRRKKKKEATVVNIPRYFDEVSKSRKRSETSGRGGREGEGGGKKKKRREIHFCWRNSLLMSVKE